MKLIIEKYLKMFESKQGQIPGYTGHQRTFEQVDQSYGPKVPQKQIPGKPTFE